MKTGLLIIGLIIAIIAAIQAFTTLVAISPIITYIVLAVGVILLLWGLFAKGD